MKTYFKTMNSIKSKLYGLLIVFVMIIMIYIYSMFKLFHNDDEHFQVHLNMYSIAFINRDLIIPLFELKDFLEKKDLDLEKIDIYLNNIDKKFYEFKIYEAIPFWQKYKKEVLKIKEATKISKKLKFQKTIDIQNDKTFKDLIAKLKSYNKSFLNETHKLYIRTLNDAKDDELYIFIPMGVIIFFATFLIIILSKNITESIKVLQRGLKKFFEFLKNKEGNVEKLNLSKEDEFSQIAKEINFNIEKIENDIKMNQVFLKDATILLKKIKKGDRCSRLNARTEDKTLEELKTMMNSMLDNLENQINEQIKKSVEKEQLLIKQSKLAAMGEMIGNIAHQWRQPISQVSAILLNLQVRQNFDKCSKEYFDEKVEEANKLTSYMSQTITDFQNFFRPESTKKKFSILEAFEEAKFIILASLKYHNISLECKVENDLTIFGYKNEYSQVILNILSNARDALIERSIDNPTINIFIKGGKKYGLIKITDNAGGIPNKIIDDIFDPYFTTKQKSKGTGIGLYMSKIIIENNMQGFIKVENKTKGACFIIKVIKS